MSRNKDTCDSCGGRAINGDCIDRDCSAYVEKNVVLSEQELQQITAALSNDGKCFFYDPEKAMVFINNRESLSVPVFKAQSLTLDFFCDRIKQATGCVDKKVTRGVLRQLLHYAASLDKDNRLLPVVNTMGACPILQPGEDKWTRPWFPDFDQDTKARYMKLGDVWMYYRGAPIKPKATGALDEFLATVRCADDENRQTLKEWLIGALLPNWYQPGGAPALLLCATDRRTGKTETAKALGYLLGGYTSVEWGSNSNLDYLRRRIMDDRNRTLIIDNLAPSGQRMGMTHFASLAELITSTNLAVIKMHNSQGEVVKPNYATFIITANTPLLTPELVDRCSVVTLSNRVPRRTHWLEDAKRDAPVILADALAYIMDNWDRDVDTWNSLEFEANRFDSWAESVARVTGVVPQAQRGEIALIQPMDWLLDQLWENTSVKRYTFDMILDMLTDRRILQQYSAVLGQEKVTREGFIETLNTVCKDFNYVEDDKGQAWVEVRDP